jgi:ParB family chromosome partitioning protein
METQVINATEHRDLPLSMLFESPLNPRRNFDESFLKGMAASMRVQGVLQTLLARPKEKRFEIVFGAQRYRAAQLAELSTIPVDIREMSDAEVLEAQLVENLQRRDVHPMEERRASKGFSTWRSPITPLTR